MKGATAGSITLRLFSDLPLSQVGWLAGAWARYAECGEEPEEVPAENLGAWLAVKEEADRIEELHRIRSEVGRIGGSKPKQSEANGSKPKQSEAEERRGEENNNNSNTSGYGGAVGDAPVRARGGGGGVETAADGAEEEADGSRRTEPAAQDGVAADAQDGGAGVPPMPEGMAEWMADCPASWREVSTRAQVAGCKAEWLAEWARHYHEQEWRFDRKQGTRRGTKAWVLGSIRAWAERQKSIDSEKRRGGGVSGVGDETVRGVRVASQGGGLKMDF